jgi:hypothetical protein
MNAAMVLVAAASLGVAPGWERLPDGGVEYIIQIAPHHFESLKGDSELASDLPTGLDVRRVRITVGTAKLPRNPSLAEIRADARRRKEAREATDSAPPEVADSRATDDPSNEAGPKERDMTLNAPLLGKDEPPPRELTDDPTSEPLKPASFNEPKESHDTQKPATEGTDGGRTETPPASPSDRPADEQVGSSDAPRPWLPMLLALVALCVSLGANVYLGWLAWQERARSRGLLEELHMAGG